MPLAITSGAVRALAGVAKPYRARQFTAARAHEGSSRSALHDPRHGRPRRAARDTSARRDRSTSLIRRLVAFVVVVIAASLVVGAPQPKPVAAVVGRPNVVIVISDDQRWDKITPQYMPNVFAWSQQATSMAFTNSFVSNPMCCPSRTTILTGRYSHTTGVWTNSGAHGGFGAFDDKHTLATDFQD